ncbi:hypothetical protein V6N13_050120 [Hibiscus sabdariffa]
MSPQQNGSTKDGHIQKVVLYEVCRSSNADPREAYPKRSEMRENLRSDLGVFGLEFGKTDFGIGLRTSKNIKYDFSEILTFWSKVNADVSKVNADITLAGDADVMMTSSGGSEVTELTRRVDSLG